RREILNRVGGFDESLPRLQDWDLWIRLAATTRFAFIPLPLARVYDTPGGISSHPELLEAAAEAVAAKLEGHSSTRDAAVFHYTVGNQLMRIGALDSGKRHIVRSVRLHAWPPQRLIVAALAALGRTPYHAGTTFSHAILSWLAHHQARS
ncbi:MAG: hypothetical protein ACRD1R_16145, partial [Acidobacteriota bacterium]